MYLKQKSIQSDNRLPDAFVERALRIICKNYKLRLTAVNSICKPCSKIEKVSSQTISKMQQRTEFRNSFLNQKCHFKTVISGLIDAVS